MMEVSGVSSSPLVGYRAWTCADSGLLSCVVQYVWTPGRANIADCQGSQTRYWEPYSLLRGPQLIPHPTIPAPVAECGCGFYAFKHLDWLLEWARNRQESCRYVLGEVYLWGKVVDCEIGYRGQRAYPKKFLVLPIKGFQTCVAERFRVPLERLTLGF